VPRSGSNGAGCNVRSSPQLVAVVPQASQRPRRGIDESRLAVRGLPMNNERNEPNAELQQTFEPLRLTFAIAALLLGLVASLHF
jgi:hypothetical protein